MALAKHIFLTGEKQVGKSTAVQRFLRLWPGRADGFLTVSELREGGRTLYVSSPDGRRRSLAARMSRGGPRVLSRPEAFEELGVSLLEESGGPETITLMDEIGFLEASLPRFPAAVLARLDRPEPVLGVLRLDDNPLLRAVAEHPSVTVLTVTEENRDGLPELRLDRFSSGKEGSHG